MEKSFILAEIRRSAYLNGGKPFGRLRLENELGIKEYYWRKFWARYNDAVAEAGFTPNEKTSALSEDAILQPLAALTRKLGKYPTMSDAMLANTNGEGVPTLKTIRTRFGNKSATIKKLADFCERTPGYEDVLQLCRLGASSLDEEVVHAADSAPLNSGYVYLFKSGKFYKIGRSNHTGRRSYELAIQLPEKVVEVHCIQTDDPEGIEAYWHNRFRERRKNGEWFELSRHDVSAFCRRKFM